MASASAVELISVEKIRVIGNDFDLDIGSCISYAHLIGIGGELPIIKVKRLSSNRYYLLEGYNAYLVAHNLNLTTVKAEIYD